MTGSKHLQGHWLLAKLGKRVLRPGGRKLTTWMVETANPSGKRVIELAPGLGLTAAQILERHPQSYIGVDEDDHAVETTQKAVGNQGKVIAAKADATGLEAQSADLIIGEAMLTMQGEKGKAAIISEAWRILAPGGQYAIHELALRPDDVAEETAEDLRKALARSILVNAELDLSTTIVLLVMVLCMIYTGGLNYKWLLGGIASSTMGTKPDLAIRLADSRIAINSNCLPRK